MFRPNTLLILGAGASQEVGMPTGKALAGQIASLCSQTNRPDDQLYDDLRATVRNTTELKPLLDAASIIGDGVRQAESIDRFIDKHDDNVHVRKVGKILIIRAIQMAERDVRNRKYFGGVPGTQFSFFEDSWFVPFVRAAGQVISKSNMERIFEGLTIMNFNYDRCLDEFLRHWLIREYAIRDNEAYALVETLDVLRPYGSIGPLPSRKHVNGIPFGERLTSSHVGQLADHIKTFTEQLDDGEELQGVRSAVANADTIIFLGFGFHDQNMELLTPSEPTRAIRVFATAKGMSAPEVNLRKEQIEKLLVQGGRVRRMGPDDIVVDPSLKCLKLFDDYRSLLTSNPDRHYGPLSPIS